MFYAEPSIFRVFSFHLIKGDSVKALTNPYTAVITESIAKKYFGSQNPIGKVIMVEGDNPITITGLTKDVPDNSQFKFDMLCSLATMDKWIPGRLNQWGNFGNYTFLMLAPNTNSDKLQSKFPAFLKRHLTENDRKGGEDYTLFLMPLKKIYMDPRGGLEQGNMNNVYIFSIVAMFILLIAAINFINLTTARSAERAKEVGVRKVVGAERKQLTIQFLGESILISLISFLFAVIFVSLLIPLFNHLAGKTISHHIFHNGMFFILLGISLLIGFVAGTYPALALSSFKPILVLKGKFSSSSEGTLLRKTLVVFQFTISIILIVGTLVVYYQLNFMRNQPLGFEKNQLVKIEFGYDATIAKNYEHFENEFRAIPNVSGVTLHSGSPGSGNSNAHSDIENRQGNMQPMNIDMYDVDYSFISLYGMKIVAGRAFSPAYGTDTTQAIVLNEAAVKNLGYVSPGDAVGKRFSQWGRVGKIIGVVKDFHYRSFQKAVMPLNMRLSPSMGGTFTLKIAAQNIPSTIAAIERKWKKLVPQRPFQYAFVDENFNKQYAAEEQFGKLFLYFAAFAIFISCIGLLGLASYSILQRTREIGIRKVLGASISRIVNMLSKEFLQLVLLSSVIAFPIAWFGMRKWLDGFAYKIDLSWWIFAIAGVSAVVTAFGTISYQAIKAAVANPVKSLRSND